MAAPSAQTLQRLANDTGHQPGLRGQPPADLDALAATLSCLSLFAAANADTIESLDPTPFLVRPSGALALDAVLVPPPTP